jgi:hypothetical protein
MANHVQNHIKFYNAYGGDEEKRMCEYLRGISEKLNALEEYTPVEVLGEFGYKIEESFNSFVDNVGAKWCVFEDFEEDYINCYSAWSAVIPMVERIVQHLDDKFPGSFATMQYEDECLNFIGYCLIEGVGVDEIVELESEEIEEHFKEHSGFSLEDRWEGEETDEADEAWYSWLEEFFDGTYDLKNWHIEAVNES